MKQKTSEALVPNSFDCIVTNPPFSLSVKKGSYEDDDGRDVLEEYDLGHSCKYNTTTGQFELNSSIKGVRSSQDSKKLFIERCLHLLKPKKYLGIVLDDGVLNNPTDAYLRDWIYNHFIVRAVISLPFEIFRERGATNRTSILVLQKNDGSLIQKEIFMAVAEHAGENYGKLGWKMPNNLNDIYHEWVKYNNKEDIDYKFSFIVKKEKIENYFDDKEKVYRNRLDPKYYNPKFKALMSKIEGNKNVDDIGNLVDFIEEISKPDEVNSFGSKYIEKITKDNQIEIAEIDGLHDPKGKEDRIFRAGDLVASRINIKSGMVAFVSESIEEIRATSEYYKFVPKLDDSGKPKILKKYLFIILTSSPMQLIMDALATGQYMRLKEEELAKIKIPISDIPYQELIINKFGDEKAKVLALEKDAQVKQEEINKKIEAIITGEQ